VFPYTRPFPPPPPAPPIIAGTPSPQAAAQKTRGALRRRGPRPQWGGLAVGGPGPGWPGLRGGLLPPLSVVGGLGLFLGSRGRGLPPSVLWGCAVVSRFLVPSASVSASAPVLAGSWVGFSGSRSWPAPAGSPGSGACVGLVVASVVSSGFGVAVGCCPRGVDPLVASFAVSARFAPAAVVPAVPPPLAVFSVASGRWGRGRGAFAARSAALVSAVARPAAGGARCAFVVFVAGLCPPSVSPVFGRSASASASACFCGGGSGSWASAALAVSLGLPVFVVPSLGSFGFLPAWWPGSWVAPASPSASPWASARRFVPLAALAGPAPRLPLL